MSTQEKSAKRTEDEQTKDLALRMSESRRTGGSMGRRVPANLRKEALEAWRASGVSRKEFGPRIGVSGHSLGNWLKDETAQRQVVSQPKTQKQKPKPKVLNRFKDVRVVPDVVKAKPLSKTFEFELPTGARVRGLALVDLLELIRAQGGAR